MVKDLKINMEVKADILFKEIIMLYWITCHARVLMIYSNKLSYLLNPEVAFFFSSDDE